VGSALTVCVVIVALFVGDFAAFNIAALIAILFVAAMLLIIVGLVFLLREINVATKSMRAGVEIALEDSNVNQTDGRLPPPSVGNSYESVSRTQSPLR